MLEQTLNEHRRTVVDTIEDGLMVIDKDGTPAHVIKNASLLRDTNGTVMGALDQKTVSTGFLGFLPRCNVYSRWSAMPP